MKLTKKGIFFNDGSEFSVDGYDISRKTIIKEDKTTPDDTILLVNNSLTIEEGKTLKLGINSSIKFK